MAIGFPRFSGGLEGYASYVAIRPPDWKFGVSVGEVAEALLPKSDKPLHFDGEGRECGSDSRDFRQRRSGLRERSGDAYGQRHTC